MNTIEQIQERYNKKTHQTKTIKNIQEQWATFHKDPANNPPVTNDDLILWVRHMEETTRMILEYPECHCVAAYLNQQIYRLSLVLNARGIYNW